jgi:hypothetical protein
MRAVTVLVGVLAHASIAAAQDRDPFAALIAPQSVDRKPAAVVRRPGLAGLTVADAMVTAVLQSASMRMAVLEGPGRRSYVVRSHDRLSDGEVLRIDASGVVFGVGAVDGGSSELHKGLRSRSGGR